MLTACGLSGHHLGMRQKSSWKGMNTDGLLKQFFLVRCDTPDKETTVVSLSGVIEVSLRKICEKIYEYNELPVKPRKHEEMKRKNRKDQSLLDIRLSYIRDVAKIRIPPHSFTASLDDLKKVRDQIVHAEGRAEGRNGLDRLAKIVSGLKGFTVKYEYIEIEKGTCVLLSRQAAEWMDHLMDACGSPYRKA
jgi:hypothetical protein